MKVFTPDGDFLMKIGTQGSKQGQLKCPNGVATDSKDNIFIADNANHQVSMFSSSGKFMQHILTEVDSVTWPEGLALSEHGKLAITEFGGMESDVVKVFRL